MAKFVMTESVKEKVVEELGDDLEETTTEDAIEKLKKTKKFVTRLNEAGEIEVSLLLLG